MRNRPVFHFFDTVVLSNFALTGHVQLLVTRYGPKALITSEELDELSDGVIAGYPCLREIEITVDRGDLGLAGPLTPAERRVYRELLRVLAPGEASCIACAAARGGVVVTDDRTARQCCAENGVACTGTIGILKACCGDGTLTIDNAEAILQAMIRAGFYSPVRSLHDLP